MPVHDYQQVEKATVHRQIGVVPLYWPAGVGCLVGRHQPRQAHEPTDTLLIALIAQVPRHLADAKERRIEESQVDQLH